MLLLKKKKKKSTTIELNSILSTRFPASIEQFFVEILFVSSVTFKLEYL